MSWGWERKPARRKRQPPAGGVRMKKAGTTWWGQRWIDALERMAGYGNRLPRGRTYARGGRTHDLVVTAGAVTAAVTGSRPRPYQVRIALAVLSDDTWRAAVAAMAREARITASLLDGQMPDGIDAAFQAAGSSLFPARGSDLQTSCSCPDWANPCKHVAATHYVLGEALDRDPFLLFELRGRTRDAVLDALRAERAGDDDVEPEAPAAAPAVSRVSLARLGAEAYDRTRGPLPSLALGFEPPRGDAVLGPLGRPEGWRADIAPTVLLGPLVREGAALARRIALAEGPEAPSRDPRERTPDGA
jgi:uncharacterized Zn finger protein